MSVTKIHISEVKKIEDAPGNYGPQKRIVITDENGRTLSGWIPADKFNAADWQVGKNIDLMVTQNGKYWNFSLPKKMEKEVAKNGGEVLEALRQTYKLLLQVKEEFGQRLIKIESKLVDRDAGEDVPDDIFFKP